MNDTQKSASTWPPFCCVAAFVARALQHFGHTVIDHRELTLALGIRVSPEKKNLWALPVEADPNLGGLLVSDAKRSVPEVLRQYSDDLHFRHVRFNVITLGLYSDALDQSLNQGCVVGAGFNRAVLTGKQGTIRHVSRISNTQDYSRVSLIDDTYGSPPCRTEVDWAVLEHAVYSVNDGFWIIGRTDSMKLELAPEWENARNG